MCVYLETNRAERRPGGLDSERLAMHDAIPAHFLSLCRVKTRVKTPIWCEREDGTEPEDTFTKADQSFQREEKLHVLNIQQPKM